MDVVEVEYEDEEEVEANAFLTNPLLNATTVIGLGTFSMNVQRRNLKQKPTMLKEMKRCC